MALFVILITSGKYPQTVLELVSEMVMNIEQMFVVVTVDSRHFFVYVSVYKRERVCVCVRCVEGVVCCWYCELCVLFDE